MNMKPTVKICGLQQLCTLESMTALPVDHIGLIFAPSRRQVTPGFAGEVIRTIRQQQLFSPLVFGVFVDPTLEELDAVMKQAPLDVIQLHGRETPEMCRLVRERFKAAVYKVFSVPEQSDGSILSVGSQLEPYAGMIDGMLIDTAGGGTGRPFAWDRIPQYSEWAGSRQIPLIVAGGLNPDNVGDLIERYRPSGVDVSSGVESGGMKDLDKITAFVERVKGYASSAG